MNKKTRIVNLYKLGWQQVDIAKEVGCKPPYVCRILKPYKAKLPKQVNRKVSKVNKLSKSKQQSAMVPTPRAGASPVGAINDQYRPLEQYYEPTFQPDLNDTRTMDWWTWADLYLNIQLFEYQVENLCSMDNNPLNIINDPRRHGKTTVCVFTFIIRKLCETLWAGENEFIAYMSAVKTNVEQLSLMIINALTFNERILQNYGYLIKETARKGRKLQKNTMTEITLKTRKVQFGSSYVGFMVSGRFRGAGAKWVIIDDPIDTFEEKYSSLKLQTSKLINTIRSRIMPVVKDGFISLIGTRYNLEDVYQELGSEGMWAWKVRQTLSRSNFVDGYSTPETRFKPREINIHDESEWTLLAPELWENLAKDPQASALQNVIYMYLQQGDRIFSCEFQNDPKPLVSVLNWDDLNPIDFTHPPNFDRNPPAYWQTYNWLAFYDDATGESERADYRAIVLMAAKANKYYLVDQHYFKDIASKKLDKIEEFILKNERQYGIRIHLKIEAVKNQREVLQHIKERARIVASGANPRGRGDKIYRIQNHFAVYLESGKLFFSRTLPQQRLLKLELDGFPHVHPDGLDAWDQVLFHLTSHKKLSFGKVLTTSEF